MSTCTSITGDKLCIRQDRSSTHPCHKNSTCTCRSYFEGSLLVTLDCGLASCLVFCLLYVGTVISGCLPARQITRSGLFLSQGEKKFNRLPTLAYYPHPKTEENHATVLLGQELTNLERPQQPWFTGKLTHYRRVIGRKLRYVQLFMLYFHRIILYFSFLYRLHLKLSSLYFQMESYQKAVPLFWVVQILHFVF